MNAQILIRDIEQAARAAKVPVAALCREAGVHRATWQRWKHGRTEPRLSQYDALWRLHGRLARPGGRRNKTESSGQQLRQQIGEAAGHDGAKKAANDNHQKAANDNHAAIVPRQGGQ